MSEHHNKQEGREPSQQKDVEGSPVVSLSTLVHEDLLLLFDDRQRDTLKKLDDVLGQGGITQEQHTEFRNALLRLSPELWEDIGFFKGRIPAKGGMFPMKAYYVPVFKSLPLHPEIQPPSFIHEVNHHFWYEKMTEDERQVVIAFHQSLSVDEISSTQYARHVFAHTKPHEWFAQAYATWFYHLEGYEQLETEKFRPIVQIFKRFERPSSVS